MSTFQVNSPFLYAVTAAVILFVLAQSVFFLVRAARRAKQLGISGAVVRKTIASCAVFTIAPAVATLPAATTTATARNLSLSQPSSDPKAYTAIAWVMTLGIIPGIFIVLFGLKKIQSGIGSIKTKDAAWGEICLSSMFLGMISALVGMLFADVREGLSGYIPIVVALISAAIMGVCGLLLKKFKWTWLEQYALPISMLGAMALSIPVTWLMG